MPREEASGERNHAPRPLWKGTLTFGLVAIPVALHRAIDDKTIHFHEIHDEDGARIRHVPVCAHDGQRVSRDHIVHGYEIAPGRHVQISPKELAELDPPGSRRIEIAAFIDPMEIDPTLYDRTYYLAPDEGSARAYALFLEAQRTRRLYAIARLVLRARRRLAVVRPAGPSHRPSSVLALSLLSFADEVRSTAEIPGLPGPEVLLGDREIDLALRLVDMHTERFHPERYHDDHRDEVRALIDRKAAGTLETPEPKPERLPKLDMTLVGALEASLRDAEEKKRAA